MILLLALLLAAEPAGAEPTKAPADAEALIANCNAHKFETTIQVTVAGKPRSSKVKLCGEAGQTDADWRRTLTDAVAKVAADEKMPIAAKEQIIAALNVEIAKIPLVTDLKVPPATRLAPKSPVTATSGRDPEYSALPPMPAPLPAASSVAAVKAPPLLPAPRLTLRCQTMSSLNPEGPCDALERDTLLTVRADENLGGGTSLRFLRRGDARGEIEVPALRSGQSRRFGLPPKLCSGVSGSRVQIEVVRAAGGSSQVVDTRGPFELRC